MTSGAKPPITGLDTHDLPLDTKELGAALRKFLLQELVQGLRLGRCRFGVYAFFDYDGEPIYVGQTRESLGTRIRRHLTNQRTDAVAMSVLDPFEVHTVAVWPLPEFQDRSGKDAEVKAHLDALEATVFATLVAESKFGAVLNEKVPFAAANAKAPKMIKSAIVTKVVQDLRGHPDLRLSRRAATIARLAQVVCERDVQPGLRRTLFVQAERLRWLAEERLKPFEKAVAEEDSKPESEEERDAHADVKPSGD
jgi:hypothetical protein